MTFRGRVRPISLSACAVLAIVAGVFVLGGCSSGSTASANPSASPTAAAASAAASPPTASGTAAVASGAATPTEADKLYARQLCTSLNTYMQQFLQAAAKDPALLTDEKKLLLLAGPAIASLSQDLQKATPPADMADYHNQLIAKAKEVSAKVETGQITKVADISNVTAGVKAPPKAVQDRLQAAITQTAECQGSLLAGSLFKK